MTTGCYLFISPHLDDVALSCGGYIRRLAEAGECVVVVTVATADLREGSISWLAHRNHMAWHAGEAPFALRRLEDEASVNALGATHLHLGLLDAMYRRDEAGRPLYVTSTTGVSVHPHEWQHHEPAVRQSLGQVLRVWGDGDARVFSPLGVGGHVDHIIVRRAVESLWDPSGISYYEDYPYAGRPGAIQSQLVHDRQTRRWHATTIELSPLEIEARVNAVACHVSQLPGLFPSPLERLLEIARARLPFLSRYVDRWPSQDVSRHRMASSIRAYVNKVGGERYWECLDDREQDSHAAENAKKGGTVAR